MKETEIWKDIKDFEGLYQISNFGRIKSLPRYKQLYSKKIFIPGCIRKPGMDKDGYLVIPLNKNGKKYMRKVHRLVAQAFLEPIDGKTVIDHIDCNIQNNKSDNLRWCTTQENINFIMQNGHMKRDNKGRFTRGVYENNNQ